MALAASFLSAVADRLGLWGGPGTAGVAWGSYRAFLDYTQTLLPIFPASVADVLATVATGLEALLSVLLVAGIHLKWAARRAVSGIPFGV